MDKQVKPDLDPLNQSTEQAIASASLPLKHSRLIAASPIYYGWLVLIAGTLGMLMTTPGQTVGVSVFLDKIIADLGLSRSAVSLMYTLGTLGGSLALPFVGRLIDRNGPRYAVAVISALFALACVGIGFVQSLLMLGLGFVFIRGLGQGALGLVSVYAINLWFVKGRGLAISLSGIGFAVGIAIFPLFIEFLIAQLGWRLAYISLGGVVALTILPIGALIFRERPGLERSVAAIVFLPFGFVMAGSNFLTGILMDRVSPRFLLSTMLVLLCASLLMAVRITGSELMLVY